MATILVAGLLLFLCHQSSAASTSVSKHFYGYCKQFSVPIHASADSAVYNIPRIDNDIDTTAWVIWYDTWSTPTGPPTVIKNTTTSGTYNIHVQLCVPNSSEKKTILHIPSHGVHYDSRYWDSEFDPETHSYVEAAMKAGYSVLTYDRLGVGQSDHPDAYTVVQAPLEVELLRALTLMARNGTIYGLAAKAEPVHSAFQGLTNPRKIVHLGHSYGSVITSGFLGKYGNLSDGAILTGWLENKYVGKGGAATWSAQYAATADPPYNRTSGYIVCQKNGIQDVFFAGNTTTAYTPEMLDYGDSIKQPVAVGELASAYHVLGPVSTSLTGPVQYMLAEFDTYICGGDCKGLANMTVLRHSWPNAAEIDVATQPNTGHALPLHNNATAGFQVSFNFLARNGL